MLSEHKKEIAMKIERCMKDYGLTEDDVKMGSAGQIKGYVMGMKEALRILEKDEQQQENVQQEENNERSTITSTRRRRSTQQ